MSGAVVHFNSGSGSGTSFTLSYATSPSPTNQLVAVLTSLANNITWTLSDSVNGSWPAAIFTTTGAAHSGGVFCLGGSNGGSTPTVTVTPSVSSTSLITLIEASGITGTLDSSAHVGTAGGQTSATIGPTGTLATSGDLLLAIAQLGTTSSGWSASTGYTVITPTSGSSQVGIAWASTSLTVGQSATLSWTSATNALGILVALTPSASPTIFMPYTSTQFFVSDRVTQV